MLYVLEEKNELDMQLVKAMPSHGPADRVV